MAGDEGRPVLTGLGALVAVAVVVGLVLGGAALGATQVLGLGGGGSSSSTASAGASMYLPEPSATAPPTDPLITLAPGEQTSAAPAPVESTAPQRAITLSSGQTAVGSMERIDLSGVYPGGDGAILQVERFRDGAWGDFPITASVRGDTFQTYVQTGVAGLNKFRVRDTRTGKRSNVVKVTVG